MAERQIDKDLELLAYADGFLDSDPALKAAVEERLRASPEDAARANAYRAQAEALRGAYGDVAHAPAPQRLLDAVERKPTPRVRPLARAAVIAVLVLSASVSGWLVGRSDRPTDWSLAAFVQDSLEDYIGEQGRPMVRTASQTEPLDLLASTISLTLRAPDLGELGYALVDKQTVTEGDRQMVRLFYRNDEGRSFSLFLRPRWEQRERALQVRHEGDVSLAYWLEGPLASAIASRLPPDETLAIAKSVQGALQSPGGSQPLVHSAPGEPSRQRGELATGLMPAEGAADKAPAPAVPALSTPEVIPN